MNVSSELHAREDGTASLPLAATLCLSGHGMHHHSPQLYMSKPLLSSFTEQGCSPHSQCAMVCLRR